MSKRSFSYCIVRYIHDPSAGESMNVGVVLFSRDASFLDLRLAFSYQRLSDAFAGFDGDGYRKSLKSLADSIAALRDQVFTALPYPDGVPKDADDVLRHIWPDQQLSFVTSPPAYGRSDDMPGTLRDLFDRFISSQYDRLRDERRTDEQVWESYRRRLQGTVVPKALRTITFQTENIEASFYGFRNERWHLFQPLSLDYAREASIKRKAKEFLGEFVELTDNDEVDGSKLYLLLGAPTHERFRKAYESAKQILRKIPLNFEFVEESDADMFAVSMDEYVREHLGLTDEGTESAEAAG
jgi:hypothetical protein